MLLGRSLRHRSSNPGRRQRFRDNSTNMRTTTLSAWLIVRNGLWNSRRSGLFLSTIPESIRNLVRQGRAVVQQGEIGQIKKRSHSLRRSKSGAWAESRGCTRHAGATGNAIPSCERVLRSRIASNSWEASKPDAPIRRVSPCRVGASGFNRERQGISAGRTLRSHW